MDGGDLQGLVLTYVRYTDRGAEFVAHNIDPCAAREVYCRFGYLTSQVRSREKCFDSYETLAIAADEPRGNEIGVLNLMPLQAVVWRLY